MIIYTLFTLINRKKNQQNWWYNFSTSSSCDFLWIKEIALKNWIISIYLLNYMMRV